MNKQVIAQRLKSLREGAKLSQAKLSQELNIKQPLIARYETAVNTPSYSVLIAYADFFDVSCDYLLGRCDEPQGLQYNCIPMILRKLADSVWVSRLFMYIPIHLKFIRDNIILKLGTL